MSLESTIRRRELHCQHDDANMKDGKEEMRGTSEEKETVPGDRQFLRGNLPQTMIKKWN